MNQRFVGPVDQVAAGDIHNYSPAGRALTKSERVALNSLVRQIEESHGEPGWKTWRFLHRVIGVDGVDAMRIEHRDAAMELLNLQLRCSSLEAALKAVELRGQSDCELRTKTGSSLSRLKIVHFADELAATKRQLDVQQKRLSRQKLFSAFLATVVVLMAFW